MSDGSFREIQLTAKQVVFLFMAGLVAAVGIFLLGVQVGQRVSPDAPGTETASAAADSGDGMPATMPPATTPRPGEITAPNDLQNRPVPTVTATPTPEPPAAAVVQTPTPTATPAPPPAKTPTAKPTAAGTHYVQIGSFSSRANADRQATELKAAGYSPEVFTGPATDRARYRVRLGPLSEQAARDLHARLRKEGIQSLVVPR